MYLAAAYWTLVGNFNSCVPFFLPERTLFAFDVSGAYTPLFPVPNDSTDFNVVAMSSNQLINQRDQESGHLSGATHRPGSRTPRQMLVPI